MKNSILFKTLIIGIIGGSLPLIIFLATLKKPAENSNNTGYNSEYLIDGNRRIPVKNANFSGLILLILEKHQRILSILWFMSPQK